MADTKISALTAVVTPASTDEFAVNQGGTSKKMTRAQVHTLEAGEHIGRSVAAGLTAAAGGGGVGTALALTSDINEISTCATAGDSVHLPTAVAGLRITVINNGAAACDVFPFTSDDLGAGVNTAIRLQNGYEKTFTAIDATNWEGEALAPRRIHLPQVNEVATPTLAFGDGDTGFYESADDTLVCDRKGVAVWQNTFDGLEATNANRWRLHNSSSPSGTQPAFIPNKSDPDTGIGRVSVDNLSLIAGGLEGVRVEDPADLAATETSLWLYDKDNATIEQVTVGAADSGGSGYKVLRILN